MMERGHSPFLDDVSPNLFVGDLNVIESSFDELAVICQKPFAFIRALTQAPDATLERGDAFFLLVIEPLDVRNIKELETGDAGQTQTQAYQHVNHHSTGSAIGLGNSPVRLLCRHTFTF